ncbi:hypothetical protein V491_02415 [Pseudogymnoascus sp. VKM F-3775]|nr:hypothetical protein V491_02415 [Pseudogymnoascus sp. VKM F-3775]
MTGLGALFSELDDESLLNEKEPSAESYGLRAKSAHVTWTSIGNVTVDGVVHDPHFSHSGKILRLRSVQGVPGNSRRDNVDDDGGVVVAYFWEDDSQTAPYILDTMSGYMLQNNAPAAWRDHIDQDCAANAGIISFDSGDVELVFESDSYTNAMVFCLAVYPGRGSVLKMSGPYIATTTHLQRPQPSSTPSNVRTYFAAVLHRLHGVPLPEAERIAAAWKLGRGSELMSYDPQTFRDLFGSEAGMLLFTYARGDDWMEGLGAEDTGRACCTIYSSKDALSCSRRVPLLGDGLL